MNIIPPSFELLDRVDGTALLQKIELAGRVCYKSEAKITPDSAAGPIKALSWEFPLANGKNS